MTNFFRAHNIVLNTSLHQKKCTIVLRPTQEPKKKIKHYSLLKAIKQINQSVQLLENYLDPNDNIILAIKWECYIKEVGEYTYYYLSMKSLDVKLNIVKKTDNTSIYVFLKYIDKCHYLAAIILDKYLNNSWKIENY